MGAAGAGIGAGRGGGQVWPWSVRKKHSQMKEGQGHTFTHACYSLLQATRHHGLQGNHSSRLPGISRACYSLQGYHSSRLPGISHACYSLQGYHSTRLPGMHTC